MTAAVTVSEKDLLALLGIVSDHRDDDPGDGLPLALLGRLMEHIPSDEVSFFGIDSRQQACWFGQGLPANDDEDGEDPSIGAFWAHYWGCLPCSYPDRSGDLRSVIRISDFYSVRQWHSTGMYSDYYRPVGYEHDLVLCLPSAPGRTVRMVFFRGPGPDFSERDRALLALLRPHLQEAYVDAELRRRGVPALTPRHWDLLHLVAAGHTNSQIGRRLGLSDATVRKHLENIFSRLQVSSRTAAVTRAFATVGPGVTLTSDSPPIATAAPSRKAIAR